MSAGGKGDEMHEWSWYGWSKSRDWRPCGKVESVRAPCRLGNHTWLELLTAANSTLPDPLVLGGKARTLGMYVKFTDFKILVNSFKVFNYFKLMSWPNINISKDQIQFLCYQPYNFYMSFCVVTKKWLIDINLTTWRNHPHTSGKVDSNSG